MITKYRRYSGVIQVHTDRCGGMSLEKILDAARESSVDFVVLSERHCDEKSRKLSGWYGDVLVLIAEEVLFPDGEFLAFDCPDWVQRNRSLSSAMDSVHRHSGAICATNFQLSTDKQRRSVPPFIPLNRVDMVCLWSFLEEFIGRLSGDRALTFQHRPERVLYGPNRSHFIAWDEELNKRHVPAIGCVNALMKKDPLLDWKEFFPFSESFRTVRTMVYTEELSENSQTACRAIWKALRMGRSYMYNHSIGKTNEFDFRFIDCERNSYFPGDSIPYRPGGRLRLLAPASCEIIFRRNGEPFFWGTEKELNLPAACPGIYRAEVWQDRRLWIATNPIRITRCQERIVPPDSVMDFT